MNYDGALSKKAQIVAAVTLSLTALPLFYFYCLDRGPVFWAAGWIADSRGYYSFTAAFLLALFPFALPQLIILLLLDRHTSLFKDKDRNG